jgi:hypothetical protein
MELNKDFRDLCALLNARNVEYLIVGGYAVAFYGAPRFTGDIDLFVRPAEESVNRMLEAVRDFGFPTADVTAEMLLERNTIVQLGRVPRQIHLMSSISGVTWETAWDSRKPGTYMDVRVFYIGREELIANKRACGRTKDLADVEALTSSDGPRKIS